jgi:DNA polymerase
MSNAPEMSDRDELAGLTHELRRHLDAWTRMGVYAVPPSAPEAGLAAEEVPAGSGADPVIEGAARGRSLAVVREELGDCTRCKLSETRKNIVFGLGAERTPLMFVGEAPGQEEDRRGEPFVGAAGQLLDKMITAMGWTRDTVYIANTLKCRPPGNRDPQPDELDQCLRFLHAQIAAIEPRIIVALGRPAAQVLLQTSAPISALRGRFRALGAIQVMPTFHPAFLLRKPERKRDAWSDLKQVITALERVGVRAPHPPRS